MFYAQKKLGWMFDWQKIKELLSQKDNIQEIRFYMGKRPNDIGMEGFFQKLKMFGLKVFSKPVKKINTEDGNEEEKANFDVEITRDILFSVLWFKKEWEKIIFFGGDSDMAPLFWDLKKIFKKNVEVYCASKLLSWELRLAATNYYLLEHLKNKIYRKDWGLTERKKSSIKDISYRRSR